MKIGILTNINEKGQLVIPKDIRDDLGINPSVPLNIILRGNVINIYPVESVITKADGENTYLALLKKTQGSWNKDKWIRTQTKRTNIEIDASKKRKNPW